MPPASFLRGKVLQVSNSAGVKLISNMKNSIPLLVIVILAHRPFEVFSQNQNPNSNNEQSILLNLREQLGNPPSLLAWNTSSSPCDWPEVRCINGAVTQLLLGEKNITVTIPATICDLKNLTLLDLAWNFIPGGFPTVLYNCTKLKTLNLSQNYFVGPIPDDIPKLSSLEYIDLGGNNFSGDIPSAIGKLSLLKTLFLYQNQFNGTFPKEIGGLDNLEKLSLAYNAFVPSPIPPEFGGLRKLTLMWIKGTNLIGKIPESFSNLSSLEHLDLAMNHLEGTIPIGLFSLKNLTYLYLYHNKLSGDIPQRVEAMNLTEIDLSMNNLIGSIPEGFGKLQKLRLLNLFSNQLSGEIHPSLGLIPSLKIFRVFTNNLSGILPPEMGLHSKLEDFEVSTNQFTGQLPQNLCAGGVLQGVVAFANKLSGQVPQTLANCSSLRTVQLYSNSFSGEIPSGIWTATNITYLLLSDNSFSGTLPSTVAWNLSRLEMNNNFFSGPIPTGVSSWVNLIVFEASNNMFSGEIPVEMTSLSRLATLLLDGNRLSGQLPTRIVSWTSLSTLNLSKNGLSGDIPVAFGSLPDLLFLDLSLNHFSGEIPTVLGNLRLNSLNLSSNQLYGRIPDAFNNLAYENSFLNNSEICAANSVVNLPNCNSGFHSSSKVSSKFLATILVIAITVFVVTVIFTLFVVSNYRRKRQKRDLATWKLTSFQRLNFNEANILASLAESNIIGSGGSGKVYRIAINRDDEFVAVKRIWNSRKLDHKLQKEFLAEVQILGTIKHSNIVKLLCCISSEDSKLLVYEYMENHSLDRWLHSKRRRSSSGTNSVYHVTLSWPTRLQIAIGAAQGLCYMHHDCSPPIIHRDVKSSNILLDSEFKAKIADFGLAKMLAKQGESHTMSAIAGSFGYIAPEHAYTTKVNEKVDVYSFGVVLLELVTGREPHFGDEHTCLAEWAWRHSSEGKSVANCFDEEIREPYNLEQMTALFKLGLICTSTLPSTRPSMKDVLQILRRFSPEENGEKKKENELDVVPFLGSPSYLSSYKQGEKGDEDFSLMYSV
ncbi:hypothetical protein K2173_016356 [Erythroxylum novogranatense]|uniref:Protein kinase domain-containing protein n=1 Tax=Erythroxylum novogranatense TaxID=1862640 RepID=A0AAV8SGM1_9ROSI|nr:hypothetical protein K2173_016356 [Erythroxylum novogranatense]